MRSFLLEEDGHEDRIIESEDCGVTAGGHLQFYNLDGDLANIVLTIVNPGRCEITPLEEVNGEQGTDEAERLRLQRSKSCP